MSPIRRETIQLKVESYTVRAGPKGTRTIRHKSIVAEGDDLDPGTWILHADFFEDGARKSLKFAPRGSRRILDVPVNLETGALITEPPRPYTYAGRPTGRMVQVYGVWEQTILSTETSTKPEGQNIIRRLLGKFNR